MEARRVARERPASAGTAEEFANRGEERGRLLDVGNVAGVLNDDQCRTHSLRGGLRRSERDRVLSSVNDQRLHSDGIEVSWSEQIEVAQALPHRLLNSPDDTKRCEIVGGRGIGKVASNAQLNRPPPIGLGVALSVAGYFAD